MNQPKIPTYKILLCCATLLLLVTGCGEKPMKMNHPHNIRGVVSYQRSFNDLNETHLNVAKKIGVTPVASREEAEKIKGKLVEIESNETYQIDELTHSIPFLVPRADKLLSKIAENFLDSLENKGLNPYKIIVTSVLRTKDDVKRLKRSNGNASDNSAHLYGTTFDVAYTRFTQIVDDRPMQEVDSNTLKMVLSEVLRDLKKQEDCYVKYEKKQGCFHITAR